MHIGCMHNLEILPRGPDAKGADAGGGGYAETGVQMRTLHFSTLGPSAGSSLRFA